MPAIYTLTINYDSGIDNVIYGNNPPSSGISNGGSIKILVNEDVYFGITPKSGYEIDSVTVDVGTIELDDDGLWLLFVTTGSNGIMTITSKQAGGSMSKSVDLSTLSGWSSLADGTHTITIKAKADGYRDSEASAGVTVNKATVNPNVGNVISGSLGVNEQFIATNDLTTYSNADQQTLTFISDYKTKELPELLTGLGFDLVQETTYRDSDGSHTEMIDLNYWVKLTPTFSVFAVKNTSTGAERLEDDVLSCVISADFVGKDENKVKLIQVQPNHTTTLSSVEHNVSDAQDTITPVTMKSGLSFLITRGNFDKTLEAGTYVFANTPQFNTIPHDKDGNGAIVEENFNFKSDAIAYNGISIDISYTNESNNSGQIVYYESGDGLLVYEKIVDDGTITSTGWDNATNRTIILEIDQQVSPEFYKWAITDGNLVKQATGETWVLNESGIENITLLKQLIEFNSNNTNYIAIENFGIGSGLFYYTSENDYDAPYLDGGPFGFIWTNTAYRTITFSTAPTGDLLTWLQANGTKQSSDTEEPQANFLTWKLNGIVDTSGGETFSISFTNSGVSYIGLRCDANADNIYFQTGPQSEIIRYSKQMWMDEEYQIIEVDTTSTNYSSFVNWAKNNGGVLLEAGKYKWVSHPKNMTLLEYSSSGSVLNNDYQLDFKSSGLLNHWLRYSLISTNSITTYAGVIGETTTAGDTSTGSFEFYNEAYRIITIENDQYVNFDFYNYAIIGENLIKQPTTTETWLLNEQIDTMVKVNFEANFTSNNQLFTELSMSMGSLDYRNTETDTSENVFNIESWTDEAYRTLIFDEEPTGVLLSWLQANAVKQ